eukprot:101910-Pleurochrysis_carterae.AAC.5
MAFIPARKTEQPACERSARFPSHIGGASGGLAVPAFRLCLLEGLRPEERASFQVDDSELIALRERGGDRVVLQLLAAGAEQAGEHRRRQREEAQVEAVGQVEELEARTVDRRR